MFAHGSTSRGIQPFSSSAMGSCTHTEFVFALYLTEKGPRDVQAMTDFVRGKFEGGETVPSEPSLIWVRASDIDRFVCNVHRALGAFNRFNFFLLHASHYFDLLVRFFLPSSTRSCRRSS